MKLLENLEVMEEVEEKPWEKLEVKEVDEEKELEKVEVIEILWLGVEEVG